MNKLIVAAGVWLVGVVGAAGSDQDAEKFWPQWRGPRASGVAPKADPPVEWGEEKNIRWKVEVPGEGNNTPIIWGDLVFVESAVKTDRKDEKAATQPAADAAADSQPSGDGPQRSDDEGRRERRRRREGGEGGGPPPEGRRGERGGEGPPGDRSRGEGRRGRGGQEKPTNYYQWYVTALDRKTGKKVWDRMVREEVPHEGCHPDGSMAPCSAITDGEHLFAYFGSRGLYAMDLQGKPLWDKDLGDMTIRNGFGEGGSPALFGDTLVVNWDHEGDSFIVALDKKTGSELWRKSRDERTTWATPLVLEQGGKAQVVSSASNRVRSYDLKTGEVLWECGGMTPSVIPSPVADFGLLYAISGFRGAALKAIRYGDARGDVTDSDKIAWSYDKDTPYVPSALLYDDTLYFVENNRAILTCLNAKTGEPLFSKQRIDGVEGIYASPLGAAGRVYIAGRDGKVVVIERGKHYKVLATNTLDDGFDASPAAVEGELYLRGHKRLYCISKH